MAGRSKLGLSKSLEDGLRESLADRLKLGAEAEDRFSLGAEAEDRFSLEGRLSTARRALLAVSVYSTYSSIVVRTASPSVTCGAVRRVQRVRRVRRDSVRAAWRGALPIGRRVWRRRWRLRMHLRRSPRDLGLDPPRLRGVVTQGDRRP